MKCTIERLGHHGDGIAEGPVFVPGALPGEVVEGDVDGNRMLSPKIITPSELRVKAPCSHYRACGGCAVMHARDDFVADWKTSVVKAALTTQGLEAPFRPILTSPPSSRRRAVFSGRRTKKGAIVGFHGRASGTLTAIPSCLLLTPNLMAALPVLEEIVRLGASRSAELSMTVTDTETGLDVVVLGGKPLDLNLRSDLAGLTDKSGLSRLTWDDEIVAQSAPPIVRFENIAVTLPAGAFLQATKQGEKSLFSAVLETVSGAKCVLDLFAGAGTFSLPLARQAEVHAVEGEADLTAALEQGWRSGQDLRDLKTETRDLYRRPLLPDELNRFDAVVLDPPRAGAEAQVAELARSDIKKIAYVSCNPVSFARDAHVLCDAGFQIDWIQIVDQFRWSPHVELAASLTKRDTVPEKLRSRA